MSKQNSNLPDFTPSFKNHWFDEDRSLCNFESGIDLSGMMVELTMPISILFTRALSLVLWLLSSSSQCFYLNFAILKLNYSNFFGFHTIAILKVVASSAMQTSTSHCFATSYKVSQTKPSTVDLLRNYLAKDEDFSNSICLILSVFRVVRVLAANFSTCFKSFEVVFKMRLNFPEEAKNSNCCLSENRKLLAL